MRSNQAVRYQFSNIQAPFGMGNGLHCIKSLLPRLNLVVKATSCGTYRFGFNGQEKDDEVAGAGNTNTALFWEYDTRLGRRWNLDPVIKEFESPYLCFSGSPIWLNDPKGDNADEWKVNIATGQSEWVSSKGGNETQYVNIVDENDEKLVSLPFPGNNLTINHTNTDGYITLDIYSGDEYNYAVFGGDFSKWGKDYVNLPRTVDGITIPPYMSYKTPTGGAISIGGVFCPGMGLAIDIGIATDGNGKSAPFLNIAVATGVDLGIGLNFSTIPAGTGLKDVEKGISGTANASVSYISGSYNPESRAWGLGFTYGMEAGFSARINKTILGSWSEMGDYYSKFGHIKR